MMTSRVKTIASFVAVGISVLLWALAFADVIDREMVPVFAVITISLGWLAWRVSENAFDWPNKGKASVYLFVWIFAVVIVVGMTAPGGDCFTDWDGRSNSVVCG